MSEAVIEKTCRIKIPPIFGEKWKREEILVLQVSINLCSALGYEVLNTISTICGGFFQYPESLDKEVMTT